MVTWRNEKVDVVIVGAGASGSVYRRGAGEGRQESRGARSGSRLAALAISSARISGAGGSSRPGAPFLLEGKNPFGYGYQAGWGVGGAALHYFANFPRLLPNDFKIKSEHGRGLDWPIAYDDVAPYYDKVAHDIGVSGDAKAEEIWRPAGKPYPMPPMKTFRNGEVWLKGFEAAGIRLVPAAVGMNSTEYKGRPACIYDGWCHVGCPIGALANPHRDLSRRSAQGRRRGARALDGDARAHQCRRATKVTGVEYYDAKKERQVQEASVVVLAAWAAQNPRLLLNSATDKHPKGLANASGLRRQIHDGPFRVGHLGDVRRGHAEPHGHHRRAVHVLRPLREDQPQGRLRQHVHRRRLGAQDERPRRLRQCARRPVRRRSCTRS